jgi:hypothetical protein
MLSETPVYYIFRAILSPFFNMASCTCPMLAAANGYKLISLNLDYHSIPYSLLKILTTYFTGIISASDLAFSIASLITGGTIAFSYVLNIYPSFKTAPLIFRNVF